VAVVVVAVAPVVDNVLLPLQPLKVITAASSIARKADRNFFMTTPFSIECNSVTLAA
jgi:hypothetical protein